MQKQPKKNWEVTELKNCWKKLTSKLCRKKWHIRIFILLLLFLAFLEIPFLQKEENRLTWVLLDVSNSVRELHKGDMDTLYRFYQKEIQRLFDSHSNNITNLVGVIFFGDDVQLALSAEYRRSIRLPLPYISGRRSQLKEAVELACQHTPHSYTIHFVVFSDGQFTEQYYQKLQATLPLHSILTFFPSTQRTNFKDSYVEEIVLEEIVPNSFQVRGYVVVGSNTPGQCTVQISSSIVQTVQNFEFFIPGRNALYFNLPISQKNAIENITAEIIPTSFTDDSLSNNVDQKRIRVYLEKPILWILGDTLDSVFPSHFFIPISISSLESQLSQEFPSVIILTKGSAHELGTKNLKLLQNYVGRGGGLLVLGNDDTLGLGNYSDTPLEESLPVLCSPRHQNPIALLVLLDVSGSMAQNHLGHSKIHFAKQGLSVATKYLGDGDYFGFVVFRQHAQELIPLQAWEKSKENFSNILQSVYPQGSTNIAKSLILAHQNFSRLNQSNTIQLAQESSADYRQNVLVVSDGLENQHSEEQIWEYAYRLRQASVTISVIATGSDSQGILQKLTQIGKGKWITLQKEDNLADVLCQEVQQFQSVPIQIGEFPVQSIRDNVLFHIEDIAYPNVYKYIPVSSKDWGHVLLRVGQYPLLVLGYYGKGRSGVFTSNTRKDWSDQNTSPLAWQDMLRWVISWLAHQNLSEKERENLNTTPYYSPEYRNLGQAIFPTWNNPHPSNMPSLEYYFSSICLFLAMIVFLLEQSMPKIH